MQRLLLKNFADRHSQRRGDLRERSGTRLKASVLDPGQVRGREPRLLAKLLLRKALIVPQMDNSASQTHPRALL